MTLFTSRCAKCLRTRFLPALLAAFVVFLILSLDEGDEADDISAQYAEGRRGEENAWKMAALRGTVNDTQRPAE